MGKEGGKSERKNAYKNADKKELDYKNYRRIYGDGESREEGETRTGKQISKKPDEASMKRKLKFLEETIEKKIGRSVRY